MRLTNEQKQIIGQALHVRGIDHARCTLCGGTDWELMDDAGTLPFASSRPGKKPDEYIVVGCTRCGNSHLVNLRLLAGVSA